MKSAIFFDFVRNYASAYALAGYGETRRGGA